MRPNLLTVPASSNKYIPASAGIKPFLSSLLSNLSDISPAGKENPSTHLISYNPTVHSLDRPKIELADIFKHYRDDFLRTHTLSPHQHNVMYDITHCRGKELGYHLDVCDICGHMEVAYNSCRNRHCPKCQSVARRKWVRARLEQLLPIAYYHTVFTLPHRIFPLSLYNKEIFYELLFDSAAKTLLRVTQSIWEPR